MKNILTHHRPRSFKKSLAYYLSESGKDYYFRIRNRNKADKTVLNFVYSPCVKKDRRMYSPCKKTYMKYCKTCQLNGTTPLSSWQFKRQMQLLGFVYQKRHRFHGTVTTAYKNIGLIRMK